MKNLITILILSGCIYTASAQKSTHQSIHKSVHDDDNTMHIAINSNVGNKTLNYDKTFNVKGWSNADKDALVKRVTDSLGVQDTPPPPAPSMPLGALANPGHSSINSDIDDDGKTLHLHISGSNKSKSFSYSRTFNVKGMSKQQKDGLIKHITDSLGISEHVQPSSN